MPPVVILPDNYQFIIKVPPSLIDCDTSFQI